MTSARELPSHPAAEMFPLMSEDELQDLASKIKIDGLKHPIVTIEENGVKMILDGRNRARACEIANVRPSFVAYEEDDPYAFAITENLDRRHLTTSQRSIVAAKFAKARAGGDRHWHTTSESIAPKEAMDSDEVIQCEAAKMLGVSRTNVQRGKRVLVKGVPELISAVENKRVSVSAAAGITHKAPEEQRRLLAAGVEAITAQANVAQRARKAAAREKNTSDADASPSSSRSDKYRVKCERVRHMFEDEGLSQIEIIQKTGWAASFVYGLFPSKKSERGALHAIIADAESTHTAWSTRAENLPNSWATASKTEKEKLIEALRTCRTSAAKLIKRFKTSMEKT